MPTQIKLHILGPLHRRVPFSFVLPLPLSTPFRDRLPQLPHMFLGYDLVQHTTEHQYGRRGGDEWNLVDRVPLLVAEEGDGGEDWNDVWDERWEGGEGVFENES